ncbi:MAG TPA: YebC/PmpR family DNA-binding transcriptional regulator [Thermoanaerobacterales bacterium]|nr:YebC/PmpR family DNA-binding transcriptional regulator [Thermoanaerobacterales bacterium]
MAGHSKWSNIKRKKEKMDAQKGKIYTALSRLIIVAAREGGGDPEINYKLKDAIKKAKDANMPNDNINRAIMRGTGELEGVSYEEVVYEGYGPGGIAIIIDLTTDNRNRTAGEIRYILDKYGGNLGESGCVEWLFDKKGVITIENTNLDEDTLMMMVLEAGAEDLVIEDENIEIITAPDALKEVEDFLTNKGVSTDSAELSMIPKSTTTLVGETAEKAYELLNVLEDHEDVQTVYCNVIFEEE